jgi:hypothetical protein
MVIKYGIDEQTTSGNKGAERLNGCCTDFEEYVSEVARRSGKQDLVTGRETKYKREAKIA